MSVENQVLELLRSKEWVYVDDFEILFPPKTEGHQSFMQRLRGLRKLGYVIDKRKKENCPHTFEYRLVNFRLPDANREFQMKNRSKMFRHDLCHLRPEPPRDEHSEALAHNNLAQETKINEASGQREFAKI